ncbi:MAG TPA: V4R domain-containing protein [archaeon]|nr:V4R domain-containing protein [archaeon]
MTGFDGAVKKLLEAKKPRKNDRVDIRYLRAVVHSLQWVSLAESSSLYLAGKKFGKEAAKSFKSSQVADVVKDLGKMFSDFGVGRLEIKEKDEKSIIVALKDSASSSGMESVGRPVCFFEAGIIDGAMEARLKRQTVVTEVLCGGLGDEVDEFLIKFK